MPMTIPRRGVTTGTTQTTRPTLDRPLRRLMPVAPHAKNPKHHKQTQTLLRFEDGYSLDAFVLNPLQKLVFVCVHGGNARCEIRVYRHPDHALLRTVAYDSVFPFSHIAVSRGRYAHANGRNDSVCDACLLLLLFLSRLRGGGDDGNRSKTLRGN